MKVQEKVDGKTLSFIHTGGVVEYVITASCIQDFVWAKQFALEQNKQYTVIGSGTNILISDKGYDGIMVRNEFAQIQVDKKRREVLVASGTLLRDVVSRFRDANLTGLEYFVGIPGTVGGALLSRVHVGGLELSELVVRVEVIDRDGKQKWVPMEYIKTHVMERQEPEIIVRVVFMCAPLDREVISERLFRYTRERVKQYHPQPSLFRPYVGLTSEVVQMLASKKPFSTQVHTACLWPQYENYLVNTGHANSEDVLRLAQGPQDAFYELTGQSLVWNVKLIGDFYTTNL